jgi:hypothetical protein
MTKTGLGEVMDDDLGFVLGETLVGSIVHVRLLKLQNTSIPLRETPLLFFPFGFLVKHLEVSPEGEDHDDAQPLVAIQIL